MTDCDFDKYRIYKRRQQIEKDLEGLKESVDRRNDVQDKLIELVGRIFAIVDEQAELFEMLERQTMAH